VHFNARDYDPHVGRWLAQDPEGIGVSGSNLYVYAMNAPTCLVDPDGNDPLSLGDVTGIVGDFYDYAQEGIAQRFTRNGQVYDVPTPLPLHAADAMSRGADVVQAVGVWLSGETVLQKNDFELNIFADAARIVNTFSPPKPPPRAPFNPKTDEVFEYCYGVREGYRRGSSFLPNPELVEYCRKRDAPTEPCPP
jgi:hypothetical protein